MLIYDLADPQELQGFVRGVQRERDENDFVLSQFLPNENIDELEWRVTQGEFRDEDAAPYRAWDTEAAIGGRQGVRRMMGELPPLSKKYQLGEEARLRRRMLDRGGDNSELIRIIFDDAAKGARSLAARLELARGEVLFTAALDLKTFAQGGIDRISQDAIDFGRSGDLEVTAADAWTDHSVEALTEELAWRTTYKDENGIDPALALVSESIVTHLLLNEQYRTLATMNGITPAFLNLAQVNQVRQAHRLPPLVTYDTKVRVDGVHTRVTPEDKMLYLPPASEPLGRTFSGTTAEALELAEANQIATDQIPGMTAVVEKTFDPVATWTKVSAIALPTLMNPNLTMVATVL